VSGAATLKAIELLRRAGGLPDGAYENVVEQVRSTGVRSEEILIQTNVYTEADLLKALSAIYQTHFVSTERLAKAEIPRATLLTIPRKVAEKLGVFPVTFDPAASVLGVVTADPEQEQVLNEIRLVAGVKQVKPFVARPAAVAAAIAKFYANDLIAFERLGQNATSYVLEYGRQLNEDGTMTDRRGSVAPPPEPAPVAARPAAPAAQPARPRPASAPTLDAPVASSLNPPVATPQAAPAPAKGAAPAQLFPAVEALVDLIDMSRPDLAGHSRDVGRLLKRLAAKLGMPEAEAQATVFAGLVHDLGKTEGHFTPLNVARAESHRSRAAELYDAPLRLLESAKLSADVRTIVASMYERFDGAGLPRKLAGEAIPRGARLLAIADTYVDLTQNPRNPYRRALSAGEALGVLEKSRGTLFDGAMVEVIKSLVAGQQSGAAASGSVLLIDADPTELERRLNEDGLDVTTARSLGAAREILSAGSTFDMVVSEALLPDGDTLVFLALARAEDWGEQLPWIFYTDKQGGAQRAFDLDALDFIVKPSSVDLVATKIRARLDSAPQRAKKGVSGSLREMSLPDIVQMLLNGQKSGKLAIRAGQRSGEVHFVEGAIVDAHHGDSRGAEAFYSLARLTDGDFSLDPSFVPSGRTITESGEALLLEAMRRLDEAL
jgi:response regulator RpfG family c-di-GMP phosphodiesterase